MAKKLTACRKGSDFLRYAEKKGATVVSGKGSHAKVYTDRGMCVVPSHAKDIGKGLRCKIMKLFRAMGIAAFLLALIWPNLEKYFIQ